MPHLKLYREGQQPQYPKRDSVPARVTMAGDDRC